MQRQVKGTRGLEAFGQRIPRAPGHAQQDEEQRLGLPAPGATPGDRLLRLPPDLRCEKVTQALQKRLRPYSRARRADRGWSHRPFSPLRVAVWSPLPGWQRTAVSAAPTRPNAAEARKHRNQIPN